MSYIPRLKNEYKSNVVTRLMKEFSYDNVMQVPKLQKIVISKGVGAAVNDKKLIAHALNERDRHTENYYNSDDIRSMISDNITEEQYDMIISYYRIMKDANDFSEDWDPYSIKTIDDFKEKINTSGHEYWGDYLLFQILLNILKINIFILNCNTLMNDYSIYNTLNEYNSEYGTIFLIYEDICHFKLLEHLSRMDIHLIVF